VLPAKVAPHLEAFDYADLSWAQTFMVRIGNVAVITVLNDSQASVSIYSEEELRKIEGPLSPLQIREVTARLASINLHLAERPQFFSEFDTRTDEYRMLAKRPDSLGLNPWRDEDHGKIMHHFSKGLLGGVTEEERLQTLENLKSGRFTFLRDAEGKFIHDHMDIVPD
jgi:hypothetical protein